MKPPEVKVLHILMSAGRGGCERDCEIVCRFLSDTRHTVLVLGERGEMSEVWEQTGARVEHLDAARLSRWQQGRLLREAVQRIHPNGVIIWHGMVRLPVMLNVLPADCGPVLVHGGNPANSLSRWVDWRYLLREKILFPRHHDPLYVCCSQYVAESFALSRYLRRFRRCSIINGVNPLDAADAHVPRALSGQETVTIGMLARLDIIKDHANLLRAFTLVREKIPAARLEFAGDGDQLDALRKLAAELGLGDSVHFPGMVQNVYGLLPRWDVFAYATTKHEGFGLALAEALMCGLPAVVTDVGPVREVCGTEEEGAAVYVPPGDAAALAAALLDLIPDLARRQALSAAARRRATTELSAEACAEHYGRLLVEERARLATHAS